MTTPLQSLTRRAALVCLIVAQLVANAPRPAVLAQQAAPPQKRYCALPRSLPFGDPASTTGARAAEADPAGAHETEAVVFTSKEVDRKAVLIRRPEPAYTQEALDLKVKGSVTLRAVLCPAGHVAHIEIVQKLSHGLTEMAIVAARNIKFKPAVKDGAPVAQYVTIQYNFDPADK